MYMYIGVSILPLSTIFRLDCFIVPTGGIFFINFIRYVLFCYGADVVVIVW
jgi:hypothetical protein